jgi:hypothetical protein
MRLKMFQIPAYTDTKKDSKPMRLKTMALHLSDCQELVVFILMARVMLAELLHLAVGLKTASCYHPMVLD